MSHSNTTYTAHIGARERFVRSIAQLFGYASSNWLTYWESAYVTAATDNNARVSSATLTAHPQHRCSLNSTNAIINRYKKNVFVWSWMNIAMDVPSVSTPSGNWPSLVGQLKYCHKCLPFHNYIRFIWTGPALVLQCKRSARFAPDCLAHSTLPLLCGRSQQIRQNSDNKCSISRRAYADFICIVSGSAGSALLLSNNVLADACVSRECFTGHFRNLLLVLFEIRFLCDSCWLYCYAAIGKWKSPKCALHISEVFSTLRRSLYFGLSRHSSAGFKLLVMLVWWLIIIAAAL